MKNSKRAFAVGLICLIVALVGCVAKPNEDPPTRVYKTALFLPEVTLSGDVEEKTVLNVINECKPVQEDGNLYSFSEVISKAAPAGDIGGYMIFTRSSKAVGINAACADEYFFTVSGTGVVSLDCNVELHREIGGFPLKGVSEILFSAERPVGTGILRVGEEEERNFSYKDFIVSRGLYVRIKDATYEGDEPMTLTLYSKRVVSAACLAEKNEDCVATLENGTNVLITSSSRYNLHWSNGGLFLVEFVSPIRKVDFRKDALTIPNLVVERREENEE